MDNIGPYKLLRQVGRGGLGVVYRAVDTRSGQNIALKVLYRANSDELAAHRLRREFRALYSIRHPNIVRVLDAGFHDGLPFLAMELVDGLPLRSYLALPDAYDTAPHAPAAAPVNSSSGESGSKGSGSGGSGSGSSGSEGSTSFGAPEEAGGARGSGASQQSADSKPAGQSAGRWAEEWVELAGDEDTDTSGSSLSWMFDDEPDSLPAHRRLQPGAQALPSKASTPGLLPPEVTQDLNRPQRLLRLKGTLVQLCSGLDFIHRRGLVHRDIKPANILVEEGGRAKLVDFGLVKLAEGGNTTAAGHVVGTYRYMSPEQARGQKVDSRSDLYALGSVLYDMLCGQPPFPQSQTFELMDAIANRLPPDPRELNPEADPLLCAVAMRLLEKKPESRFQQASEVAALLG